MIFKYFVDRPEMIFLLVLPTPFHTYYIKLKPCYIMSVCTSDL